MAKTYYGYMAGLGVTFLLSLWLVVLVNSLVDPFGAYRFLGVDALESYYGGEYVSTAEAFLYECPEVVVVGSSRVLDGIPGDYRDSHQRSIFRAAVRGTSWREQSGILSYLIAHDQAPGTIVFGLDLDTFLRESRPSDFEHSRFSNSFQVIDYHAQNLVSMYALNESLEVLKAYDAGSLRKTDLDSIVAKRGNVHLFETQIRRSIAMHSPENAVRSLDSGLEELGSLIDRACDKRIDFRVVFLPVHALSHEKLLQSGYGEFLRKLKRGVVAVCSEHAVPVFDFTGYTEVTTEQIPWLDRRLSDDGRMRWFFDPDHFTPQLGTLVLDQVLDFVSGATVQIKHGRLLDKNNVAHHLSEIEETRQNYIVVGSRDLKLLQKLALTQTTSLEKRTRMHNLHLSANSM